MKKLTVTLAFFLTVVHCFSQFEMATYGFWNGELFQKSPNEFFYVDTHRLKFFDENIENIGNSNSNHSGEVNGAFVGNDSSVYLVVSSIGHVPIHVIFKYDKDWNLERQEQINLSLDYFGYYFGAETSDSLLIIGNETNLQALDSDWEDVWDASLPGELNDIFTPNEDTIVAVTTAGILLFSDNGIVLSNYPAFDFEHTVLLGNGKWVGQKVDSLYFLSPDFELLATIGISNEEVLDLENGFGKIVLLTSEKKVFIYDKELVFLDSFTLSGTNLVNFSNFELAEDGFIVTGNSGDAHFIKKYDWDGTNLYSENNDVGIVSYDLSDFEVEPFVVAWLPPSNFDTIVRLTYLHPKFTVRNYGETVINSFDISTHFPVITVGTVWYDADYFNGFLRKSFSGTPIEPGEEKEVTWSNLEYYFHQYPNGEFYDKCFSARLPNGRVDDDPSNNSDCNGFTVDTDEEFFEFGIEITPNPASDMVKISLLNALPEAAVWNLYDQTGQVKFSTTLPPHANEQFISLPSLIDGFYFWTMQTGGQIFESGKLVIQN